MPFTLTISTDNADFTNGDQYDPAQTLAQLLHNVADTLVDDMPDQLADAAIPTVIGSVRDRNGNHVGEWRHDRP